MTSPEIGTITVIAIAFIGSIILTRLMKQLAIIDIPNERSSHFQPTPRGGGVALVTMTIVGLVVNQFIWQIISWRGLTVYLVAATLIAIVSWLDDVKSLSTKSRMLIHFVAAGIIVVEYGYLEELNIPLIGSLYLGRIGALLSILWIVGLTNAYNFMDGIDGIAGGQSFVAGISWGLIGWTIEDRFLFAIGGLVAASSLGFLFYNWAPARIFMGDVGSAFLGFTFAVIPVIASRATHGKRDFMTFIGFLLIWPFILDTGFTLLRRLSKGENVFQAHRSHLYQRMVIAGYSHRIVSLLYIGLAVIGSIVSLTITDKN